MADYVSTLQAGTDQFCSIGYAPTKASWVRTKCFQRLSISSALFGLTPTAAVLSVHSYSGYNPLVVSVKTSIAAWDGSSTVSTLDASTLSAQLDSQSCGTAGFWTNFNVLGDSGKGVIEACLNSRSNLTCVLLYAGSAPTVRVENASIGTFGNSIDDYRNFDRPGSGSNLAFLTITAGSSIRYPVPGCAVGGLLF